MPTDRCPICHSFVFFRGHVCPPAWETHIPEWDSPDHTVMTYTHLDEETAAEQRLSRDFYDLDCPEEREVWARKAGADEWQKFIVKVEMRPEFSAEKKEDE